MKIFKNFQANSFLSVTFSFSGGGGRYQLVTIGSLSVSFADLCGLCGEKKMYLLQSPPPALVIHPRPGT